MTKKKKIGVIFGGRSSEKEVSLATGRYVYSLLDPVKFIGVPLFMDEKGLIWKVTDKLVIQNTTADVKAGLRGNGRRLNYEDLPKMIDLMFIALLGKYGEDGCIQGLLELLGVPYTGSGVLASAVGMDKSLHRGLLEANGFDVARGVVISKIKYQKSKTQIKNKILKEIRLPCVIKPSREGSSIGVSVVKQEAQVDGALKKAFRWDRETVVEEYLQGMEWTCVVWGNKNPKAMLPTEVVFTGDFFDYESKYMPGKTQTITPARVAEPVLKKIQKTAERVSKLIGIVGYGRVDGFLVKDKIYVTEPHTGSIMVPASFVFQQAAQYRMELVDEFTGKKGKVPMSPRVLVEKIIEMADEAHGSKKGYL